MIKRLLFNKNDNEQHQKKDLVEGNNYHTTIHRVNEYSYVVSIDQLEQEETDLHSEKSILTNIHTEFLRNRENLLNNHGFIQIKEYNLNGYKCRCYEQNDLLNNENNKQLLSYKIEF